MREKGGEIGCDAQSALLDCDALTSAKHLFALQSAASSRFIGPLGHIEGMGQDMTLISRRRESFSARSALVRPSKHLKCDEILVGAVCPGSGTRWLPHHR